MYTKEVRMYNRSALSKGN